ncbi:MAG TPA: zeta toxin family protein [Pirellulales bacterium]|nr:zeta toxin family protein [Pirellulales bacterium]
MSTSIPKVVVLAGPNGAGKTTAAQKLLQDLAGLQHFVNADWIARGLSGFNPDATAIEAGRVMLARLKQLAALRASFAFETTLASRTFAPWIEGLCKLGYESALIFLWLPSAEHAIARVADRVRTGGHHVPDETVRRRYIAGLRNFFNLYQPLAVDWRFYDNSGSLEPRLLAAGSGIIETIVADENTWTSIKTTYSR